MHQKSSLLKELIKSKNTTIRAVAHEAGIPATTLYSAVSRGGGVRLDMAMALAEVLDVSPDLICDKKYGTNCREEVKQ